MNKIKYTTALLLGGLLSFSSCTDNFADFNSTDGAYTEELQKYDNQTNLVPFATIQKGIIYQTGVDGTDWQYQVIQNLVADMFCGYFHDMNGSFNANNSTYNLNNGHVGIHLRIRHAFHRRCGSAEYRKGMASLPRHYQDSESSYPSSCERLLRPYPLRRIRNSRPEAAVTGRSLQTFL